ncbi:hypothetical protein AVEN_80730-1 [Araneus ventricosus]|uniref:Uncharacterized protein n=1 Tax=Araneus ventricosus TaxID=182803 RepID=A0A4Y2SKD3_ARAVE|nr:hypothetical protein AVEN_80730-1 [Araneus ventricosus]
MEKQLSFVLKLSLEEMALRRVVVNLWNEADVLATIKDSRVKELADDAYREPLQIRQYKKCKEWRVTVENKVKTKVSKLVLPESLKKRMMHTVTPIGLQIQEWEMIMDEHLRDSREDLDIRLLEQLCWTYAGKIDFQKTVEKLVSLEMLDPGKRYRLACLYCLEDSISVLWEELPEDYKTCFRDEPYVMPAFEVQMEFYWADVLKGEESKLDHILTRSNPCTTFRQYAFERSAYRGNRALTEYFFQKLTYEERDSSVINSACNVVEILCKKSSFGVSFDFPTENPCGVLCYLLSVMTSEEQMQVFKKHPVGVLICLLDWPWQDIFLEIADFIWTVLPETKYELLTAAICVKIKSAGYYFPNLIQKFFLRSPSDFRRSFIREFSFIFRDFSYPEDTETIKVLFRNIDLEDRKQLASSHWFPEFLKGFILEDNWNLVELGLREATLSEKDRQTMQFYTNWYITLTFEGEEGRDKVRRLKRCFESLDEAEASAPDIRSSEINHWQTLW